MLRPFLRALAISGAALSVVGTGGQREVVASSDSIAARLEELQFELGEGPGYDVIATGVPRQTELGKVSVEGAPFFDAAVRALRAATVITLPLKVGASVLGVVTLYREEPGLLSEEDMTTAAALVHWVAGPAITWAISAAEKDTLYGGLQKETFRREVHQATGMISAQLDMTLVDAFAYLKAHAFTEGETVEGVAHKVVTRRLVFQRPSH